MLLDQVLFNWVIAVVGFLGGWILKVIWDAITDLKRDIRAMDTKMHEDFVRRDDFKDAITHVQKDMDEIKTDMKEGFKTVNATLGLIFKRLENKEDRS